MTIEEIKAAVDAGKPVRWSNDGYHVTKGRDGQYLITFQPNQNTIGLTNRAGDKLNGQPDDFYIAEVAA
ncbi:MAG: hypothetical protein WBB25_13830 [Sulfitobacter sp.]